MILVWNHQQTAVLAYFFSYFSCYGSTLFVIKTHPLMRKGSVVALVQLPVACSNCTASNRKLGVGLGTRLGLLTIECFFGCAEPALIEPVWCYYIG